MLSADGGNWRLWAGPCSPTPYPSGTSVTAFEAVKKTVASVFKAGEHYNRSPCNNAKDGMTDTCGYQLSSSESVDDDL